MENEKKSVALSSVIAAVFITAFKFVVGVMSGSLGIMSEALHSGLDMVAALITYFSVKVSDKPADEEHNYGHGKIENLSALVETVLLLVTCVWIVYEAISRLMSGNTHIEISAWSYVVVICSIIIDVSRSRALSRVAKKHNSQALEADALHFATDVWSSAVVLLGLVSYQFLGWYAADAVAALFVAVIVLIVSYQLGRKAIDVLLDKSPKDTLKIAKDVLTNYPQIRNYHSMKARTAGADTFIKINIHFEPDMTLKEVHQVCDRIEAHIKSQISRCEVFIHAEPEDEIHTLEELP
jgi:cation diffusion facilitator family transporter